MAGSELTTFDYSPLFQSRDNAREVIEKSIGISTLPDEIIIKHLHESAEKYKKMEELAHTPNSARARRSDLRYFWTWAMVNFGIEEHYPVKPAVVTCFTIDHLTYLNEGVKERIIEILKKDVKKRSKKKTKVETGFHKLSTVKRRLSSLKWMHDRVDWYDDKGERIDNKKLLPEPVYTPEVKHILKLALSNPVHKKSKKPGLVEDKIKKLLKHLLTVYENAEQKTTEWYMANMFEAMLRVMYSSGGRRPDEIENLTMDNVRHHDLPGERPDFAYIIHPTRTKTSKAGEESEPFPVKGDAALSLERWLTEGKIENGPLFRGFDRYGEIKKTKISRSAFRKYFLKYCQEAGLGNQGFSLKSVRVGFITDVGDSGVSQKDGMAMSGHKSPSVFLSYQEEKEALNNPAANLLDERDDK